MAVWWAGGCFLTRPTEMTNGFHGTRRVAGDAHPLHDTDGVRNAMALLGGHTTVPALLRDVRAGIVADAVCKHREKASGDCGLIEQPIWRVDVHAPRDGALTAALLHSHSAGGRGSGARSRACDGFRPAQDRVAPTSYQHANGNSVVP